MQPLQLNFTHIKIQIYQQGFMVLLLLSLPDIIQYLASLFVAFSSPLSALSPHYGCPVDRFDGLHSSGQDFPYLSQSYL